MTYEKAQNELKKWSITKNPQKLYICPNPKTDEKGYTHFLAVLKQENYPSFFDPKKYSNNNDFNILEMNI